MGQGESSNSDRNRNGSGPALGRCQIQQALSHSTGSCQIGQLRENTRVDRSYLIDPAPISA